MAFTIRFTDGQFSDEDSTWAVGHIVAGELDEDFLSDLCEWDKRAYESQWLQSLEGLLSGDSKAVLITHYVNQGKSLDLGWWALYRDGDAVRVQNHFPFGDFKGEFSVPQASKFLQERMTVDEDRNSLSEWHVPLRDIELFVAQIKQQRTDFPK